VSAIRRIVAARPEGCCVGVEMIIDGQSFEKEFASSQVLCACSV
jgi:hypothetical protein